MMRDYFVRIFALVAALYLSVPDARAISGLHWNVANENANSDVRFRWSAPPDRWPITILYKYKPHQQTGYYATVWYTSDDGAFSGASYYQGGLPYPPGGSGGTEHRWEVAHDGTDTYTTNVITKGNWYPQGFTAALDGSSNLQYLYYFAVDSGVSASWYVSTQTNAGNLTSCGCTATSWSGGGYMMEVGASPWTTNAGGDASANSETLYGVLRDIQIFDTILTASDIATEMATESNAAITAVGQRHLWYSNLDPIPTDITDKSGAGHNPSWVNALRPAQWDSTVTDPVTGIRGGMLLRGVGR